MCVSGWLDSNMRLFPPKTCSNYGIHMFLWEMMEVMLFHIIMKSNVGAGFDNPLWGTSICTPTLLFITETLHAQNGRLIYRIHLS